MCNSDPRFVKIIEGNDARWYFDDVLHRTDGPAEIIYPTVGQPSSIERWYWHGTQIVGLVGHPQAERNLERYMALTSSGREFIQQKYLDGLMWSVNPADPAGPAISHWDEWLSAAEDSGL